MHESVSKTPRNASPLLGPLPPLALLRIKKLALTLTLLLSLPISAQTRPFTEYLMPVPVSAKASHNLSNDRRIDTLCTPAIQISGDANSIAKLRSQFNGPLETLLMKEASLVCKILYKDSEAIPNIQRINIVAKPENTFLANTERSPGSKSSTISIGVGKSVDDMGKTGIDTSENLIGIFIHELTHVYQQYDADGLSLSGQSQGVSIGLLEGIADYVRTTAGYLPPGSFIQIPQRWDLGYMPTAYFLLWIETHRPGFMFELNQSLSNTDGKRWTVDEFNRLTGHNINELWNQYQKSVRLN